MSMAGALGRWFVAKCRALYEWESTLVDRAYPPSSRTLEARRLFVLVPHPIVTDDTASADGIQELDKRMRPGALSGAVFLGAGESLLDVMRSDESFLATRRISHADIAGKLQAIFAEYEY